MKKVEYQAALSLTECKVIRVAFAHPGFIGLCAKGLAYASPVKGKPYARDYRLLPGFEVRRPA